MHSSFPIGKGAEVFFNNRLYRVEYVLSNQIVQAKDLKTGESTQLKIADLTPPENYRPAIEPLDLDKPGQAESRRRYAFVKKALDNPNRTREDVKRIANEAGVNERTMYKWMALFLATRRVSSLTPKKRSGGKMGNRLNPKINDIVQLMIAQIYLTKQRKTIKSTHDEVRRHCIAENLKPPTYNSVRKRILDIPEEIRLKARGYGAALKKRLPRPGTFTDATDPLSIAQIDHTTLDIILVDELYRRPIGRPYLTCIIDVKTRGILGYYLSLDPTGRITTSLALAHAILPKEGWLSRLEIASDWPFRGRPRVLILDNAREFDCPWLTEACQELGIEVNYRPVKTPHFGAHIERFFGTLEGAIHQLPGTTFSNPTERGDYDSDSESCMTMVEFDRWLAEWVANIYHQKYHDGILKSPIKAWNDAVLGTATTRGVGLPDLEEDPEMLRINLLPSARKTVQPTGIRLHYIDYYSPILRNYIEVMNADGKKPKFIVRYDPRDLGTIYFWDPELKQYFELTYRTPHPPMSMWEYLGYRKELKAQGLKDVDEEAIFAAKERNDALISEAALRTKTARRANERRDRAQRELPITRPALPSAAANPPDTSYPTGPVKPFEVDGAW
ncbi:MAG TPA: Mu transposase C-terminal domain-containing protein [Candidatus Baltobacteraceae bacterium]|jgi:putative transposase